MSCCDGCIGYTLGPWMGSSWKETRSGTSSMGAEKPVQAGLTGCPMMWMGLREMVCGRQYENFGDKDEGFNDEGGEVRRTR